MRERHRPPSLLILILFAIAGCSDRDTDRISAVSLKAFDRATALTQTAGERIGLSLRSTKAGLDQIEVSTRVAYRLKWDQVLEGNSIQVQAEKGVVTLTGAVKHDVQRQRAVELAQATVGVEMVRESLEIAAEKQ
jgi:osmotically-inducible protein OsmY